jgi:dolichyl-phosphate beta-glucosyltransferase
MTDISVVIPALDEARKIRKDVESAAAFFQESGLRGEVIVVDDGSSDGTDAAARGASVPAGMELKVIRLEKNRGKGFAVRTGVMASQGDVVLFADSGSCVPYADALPQIRRIRAGELDVALASRRHPQTVIHRDRPWKRRFLSRVFHLAAVLVAGLPRGISDPQCGFKLYRGDAARELYSACRTSGFLFDLEIILRARRRGMRMEEFAVRWTCDLDTRLRPGSDAPLVLRELLQLRRLSGGRSPRSHPDSSKPEETRGDGQGVPRGDVPKDG